MKDINFNEDEARDMIRKILQAVHHMHTKGFFHRDLKPENIMYSSRGDNSDFKLIDFGLAKNFTHQTNNLTTVLGTPSHISPEVIDTFFFLL